MANRSLLANSDAIVITTDGRTDRHGTNVLEFCTDQMSPRNLGSKINISAQISHLSNIAKEPRVPSEDF